MTLEKVGGAGVIVEAEGPFGTPPGVSSGADVPTVPGIGRAGVALDGVVYITGGEFFGAATTTVEYDPDTDTFTSVAGMNTGRLRHGISSADGSVFVFGGDTDNGVTNSVEKYDPQADSWTTVSSLSTARRRTTATEANGAVYVIGGQDSGNTRLSSVEEYDPVQDSFSSAASLATARSKLASASQNGLVYAIGGVNSSPNTIGSVEQYDETTNSWSTVASLNTRRSGAGAVLVDGQIHVVGGENTGTALADIERYDSNANSWTVISLSLTTARDNFAIGGIGEQAFVFAGEDNGQTALSSTEIITFSKILQDAYTASGDALVNTDGTNAEIRNETTGVQVTGEPLIARDGETISFLTSGKRRLFRTQET
jgi:N-acetylneuraminic acid mutarotase